LVNASSSCSLESSGIQSLPTDCEKFVDQNTYEPFKVVEGSEIYNFGIITLGHFSSNFQSYSRSNNGSRIESHQNATSRCATTFPRSRALAHAAPHHTHIEAGSRPSVHAPHPLVMYPVPRGAPSRVGRTVSPCARRFVRFPFLPREHVEATAVPVA
jgi:hypothetical protein